MARARTGSQRRPTRKQREFIARKIPVLIDEGYSQRQAIAIAYRMAGVPPRQSERERDPQPRGSRSPRCQRGMQVQSLLFPPEWTMREARQWARQHGYDDSQAEREGPSVRIRQFDPADYVRGSFRTMVLSEPDFVRAIVACPRPGFQRDRW